MKENSVFIYNVSHSDERSSLKKEALKVRKYVDCALLDPRFILEQTTYQLGIHKMRNIITSDRHK